MGAVVLVFGPMTVVEGHRVTIGLLDETFAGPVGASVVAELLASQHSRRLLLLKLVRERVSHVDEAWAVLVAADRHAPAAVRAVLTYPAVGAWLVRAVRRAQGSLGDDPSVGDELDHLGAVAAAAAVRAGVPAAVDVPVWHGVLTLPTIGQFEVGADVRTARVRHTTTGTFVEIPGAGPVPLTDLPGAHLRQHLSRAGGIEVCWTIDDIDPYREFATAERPARLGDAEYSRWCRLLDDAWAVLVRRHAEYAAEFTHIEPVIVPLSRRGLVASSSSSSFGAIIVAAPDSATTFAETLVHEVQHSKLNAVFDLVRLEHGAQLPCYAPWRQDPRPLSGLLHGIYAFTSVTEFWYRQREEDRDGRRAEFKFLYHREQVRAAVRFIDSAPQLTELGDRFLTAIRARLVRCDDETASEELADAVALLLAQHRFSWRLRHLAPADLDVEEAARRWRVGDAPPMVSDAVPVPDHRRGPESSLPALVRAKVLDPDRLAVLPAVPGERDLVDGRRATAARAFAARLAADPEDDRAWVGLACASGVGEDVVPIEVVAATHRRLGAEPDAAALVDWFATRTVPG